jgi:hypothetical protein
MAECHLSRERICTDRMRENQPKHRQMRKEQRRLARQKASREGMPSVLIVCEGRQTEPNYIAGLCAAKRVNLAALRIHPGDNATDAVALVRKAQRIFNADRDFDRVFVVCDDDGAMLERARGIARRRLRRLDGKFISVELIASRPCFEFWLLLHFEYSLRPYRTAAEVVTDLRRHLTDYDKANPLLYQQVSVGLDQAIERVGRLKQELTNTGATVPDTDLLQLIEQLLAMRHNA